MRPIVFPFKMQNRSSKLIAEALETIRVYHNGSYRYRDGDLIINWGSGGIPEWWTTKASENTLNKPRNICYSVNKLKSFSLFAENNVPIPDYTRSMSEAIQWVRNGSIVFCRTDIEGRDGSGIVLARNENEVVDAPLYTKYANNRDEYRVHIFKNSPIFWVSKLRMNNTNPPHGNIVRSGDDFVFAQCQRPPQGVIDASIKAVAALGLDFGAVDVGWNNYHQRAYVFENNTAPGGFGPLTLAAYVNAFRSVLN